MGLRIPPWYMSLTFLIIIGAAVLDSSGSRRTIYGALLIIWIVAYAATCLIVKSRARRRPHRRP